MRLQSVITASVVAYHHSYSEIGKVLDCLLKSPVAKIYVVDNSSNDALRLLERISGRIRYIHSANIGYGGAHNIAMREAVEAGADYHVIVNPDIWFGEGVIEILAAYMDRHPDAGLVAPKTVYPDGETQYLCKLLPTPFDLILRRFLPAGFLKSSRERFELRFTGYDREMNVPFLSGCFMFLRIGTLKETGLFDERYFMYAEDIDFSRRIHRITRTVYCPDCPYFFALIFSSAITSSLVLESRFPVGSSANKISGLFTKALAIATRCCCPPERVFGRL